MRVITIAWIKVYGKCGRFKMKGSTYWKGRKCWLKVGKGNMGSIMGDGKYIGSGVTSVPASRDAPRGETNQQLGPLKSLPRKSIKIWLMKGFPIVFSPPGNLLQRKLPRCWLYCRSFSLRHQLPLQLFPPAKSRPVIYFDFRKHSMIVL